MYCRAPSALRRNRLNSWVTVGGHRGLPMRRLRQAFCRRQVAYRAAWFEACARCGRSEAKFAVRAKSHQIEMVSIGLAVNQHQVGPDMTVPVVFPLTAKRVVSMARRQRIPHTNMPSHQADNQLGLPAASTAPDLFLRLTVTFPCRSIRCARRSGGHYLG